MHPASNDILARTLPCCVLAILMTGASPIAGQRSDVTDALVFSDPKNCLFAPRTEAIFNAMLRFDQRKATWLTQPRTTIGPMTLSTHRTVTPKEDVVPGGKFFEVSVRFPAGTLWHGLHLIELRRSEGHYPETDSIEEREFAFLESSTRVQAVLKQAGVTVPIAPKYRDIGQDMIGAMSLATRKGQTILNCSWGA
jgi:hypothetical protein